MSDTPQASWPAVTMEEAHQTLTAPETIFEMQCDPIPRNASGKIAKAPLREQFLKYSKDIKQ